MAAKTSRVRTDTLMRRIIKADALDDVLRQNETSMHTPPFNHYLAALCRERALVPERVIRESDIDRSYGHQLFNGLRQPSRDKALQLAFGLKLGVSQAQELLRVAGKSQLYPRLKRDAIILFALNKSMSVLELQSLLNHYGMTPLGGIVRHDD